MSNNLKHILVIGMPGSGKTSMSRQASKINNMDVLDIDSLLVEKYGKPISTIFEEDGEEGFREKETAILRELSEKDYTKPTIFSTGGGIVTRPENIPLMKKLGKIIFIHRDVGEIANAVRYNKDRPLLEDKEKLYKLWEDRENLYRSIADAIILNEGNYRESAHRLAMMIREL